MCVFIFLLPEQKKNETKRKFAGSRSGAKKWRFFLNEKNSLRSNSFSFLTLHTSPFISRSKSEAGHTDATLLRSLKWMFLCILLLSFILSKRKNSNKVLSSTHLLKIAQKNKNQQRAKRCLSPSSPPTSQGPAFSGGA